MKISVQDYGLAIERHIRPPLQVAITLPVTIDGQEVGIAVYVTASEFAPAMRPTDLPISVLVAKVAAVICQRVKDQTIF